MTRTRARTAHRRRGPGCVNIGAGTPRQIYHHIAELIAPRRLVDKSPTHGRLENLERLQAIFPDACLPASTPSSMHATAIRYIKYTPTPRPLAARPTAATGLARGATMAQGTPQYPPLHRAIAAWAGRCRFRANNCSPTQTGTFPRSLNGSKYARIGRLSRR